MFVLMPLREEFDDIYLVIRDAVQQTSEALRVGITCGRADEIAGTGQITDQIIQAIDGADLLIADLSGANPNVMYELGLADARGKPAIIITQDATSLPFDVSGPRAILYDRGRLFTDLHPSLVMSITKIIEGGLDASSRAIGSLAATGASPEKIARNRVFIS